jgi:hypothetical protein
MTLQSPAARVVRMKRPSEALTLSFSFKAKVWPNDQITTATIAHCDEGIVPSTPQVTDVNVVSTRIQGGELGVAYNLDVVASTMLGDTVMLSVQIYISDSGSSRGSTIRSSGTAWTAR